MASEDWSSTTHTNEFDFMMVAPNNLTDESYGRIEDVDLSSVTITESYYSDTRISGKLSYYGDSWIRQSFIRIRHRVPEWNYSNDLGTFLVTDDGSSRQNGTWKTTLTLHSMLYALKTQLGSVPWTVGAGTTVKDIVRLQLGWSNNRPYRFESTANDYSLNGTMVFESGKTILERITAATDLANDRIDVDPYGIITVDRYVSPKKRTKTFSIDMTSARGSAPCVINRTSDYLRIPGRVVVSFKYNEQVQNGDKTESVQREIDGDAAVSVGFRSPQARGYQVVDFYSVSDLNPATKEAADALAKSYLDDSGSEDLEWTISDVLYLPVHEGDVGTLKVPETVLGYAVNQTVMIKSVDIHLSPMTCDITLKSVESPDEESGY